MVVEEFGIEQCFDKMTWRELADFLDGNIMACAVVRFAR
jgi:hypothetical protein